MVNPSDPDLSTLIKVLIATSGGSFAVVVGVGFKLLRFLWTLNQYLSRTQMRIELMWSDYARRKGISDADADDRPLDGPLTQH